jgi:hypothetical protein
MCQIIRIDLVKAAGASRIEIFPEKITVPVGTCTVWINWITGDEVQVSFRENAKACIFSADAKSEFDEMQLKSGEVCYISKSLPFGKTTSIYCNKPSIYKYHLEIPKSASTGIYKSLDRRSAEGVIEVK